MPPGELVNTKTVSEILGYPTRTVTRMAGDGRLEWVQKLPGLRGDYLFDRAYIESLALARMRRDKGTTDTQPDKTDGPPSPNGSPP